MKALHAEVGCRFTAWSRRMKEAEVGEYVRQMLVCTSGVLPGLRPHFLHICEPFPGTAAAWPNVRFKKYDQSGDGVLDRSEIKTLLAEMGYMQLASQHGICTSIASVEASGQPWQSASNQGPCGPTWRTSLRLLTWTRTTQSTWRSNLAKMAMTLSD